jgi:hypothetical protein
MKIGKREALLAALGALLLFIVTPDAIAEGGSLVPSLSAAKGPVDLGIIFSSNDLLLGLQNYEGGLGAKIGWGKWSVRGLFDVNASQSSQALGVTLEYYILPGPISPYFGGLIGAGYLTQTNVTSVLSFSVGAVAGVEVFILDFLSVFAEYALTANFSNTTDPTTSQSTFDYNISTGMGNNARLGIVIYFMREGKSK